MKKQLIILTTIIFAIALCGTVNAADTYVNDSVSSSGDGLSWETAYKTIKEGITGAADGSTVNIASGTYKGANNKEITINKNVTIQGAGQDQTIIDLENSGTAFYVPSGRNVTIKDLTIQKGNGYLGTIQNNGILNVINSTFNNNNAAEGGGAINNQAGSLTVTGCTFTGNTATSGGGAIINWAIFAVTDSTFTGNNAIWGGAIFNYGTCTVTGSTFIGNTATENGGAIHKEGYSITNFHFNSFYNNNAPSGSTVYSYAGYLNATYNWWGSNANPSTQIGIDSGIVDYSPWLFMTISANPNPMHKDETSLITVSFNNYSSDGINYTPFDPATGHIPDGTPVAFSAERSINGDSTTSGGLATATLTADGAPGEADVNAVTDAQTVSTSVIINAKSSLYLTITPNKTNPVVGDTVIYTLKVGNNGPDSAENVVLTYMIPEGLEFVTANDDTENTWKYNETTRTITWNLGTVPKGDPNLWLTLRVAQAGQYLINPTLTTSTYDPTLNNNVQSLAINAAAAQNSNESTTVYAATENTVEMQETGLPIAGLGLAVLALFGGLSISNRK